MRLRPVHHTFGPMVTGSQMLQAGVWQCAPWRWKNGPERERFRSALETAFTKKAFLFDSGRGALLSLLRAMDIGPGNEVIVQAFTCIAVPNAVAATGAVPIFADIDPDSLNIDPAAAEKLINHRTAAIICQHTFGIKADTSVLRKLCDDHGIALIEDCAHILSPETGIGTVGDAIICSFGRDKAISGVAGGAALVANPQLIEALSRTEAEAADRSIKTIVNLVDYPLRYAFAKAVWRAGIGKAYLAMLAKLRWLPRIYEPQERAGYANPVVYRMPNACAALALAQWRRRDRINARRKKTAQRFLRAAKEDNWSYATAVTFSVAPQKFPIFVEKAADIRAALKLRGIHLDDGWTGGAINPPGIDPRAIGYEPGSCPRAESLARTLLSLPCHPTMTDAQAEFLIRELRRVS